MLRKIDEDNRDWLYSSNQIAFTNFLSCGYLSLQADGHISIILFITSFVPSFVQASDNIYNIWLSKADTSSPKLGPLNLFSRNLFFSESNKIGKFWNIEIVSDWNNIWKLKCMKVNKYNVRREYSQEWLNLWKMFQGLEWNEVQMPGNVTIIENWWIFYGFTDWIFQVH